jgi:hypothetical protein
LKILHFKLHLCWAFLSLGWNLDLVLGTLGCIVFLDATANIQILTLQVLPSRTHPHMMSSGTGGFLLSGTRVLASEQGGQPHQQQQGQQTNSSGGNKRSGWGRQKQGAAKRQR